MGNPRKHAVSRDRGASHGGPGGDSAVRLGYEEGALSAEPSTLENPRPAGLRDRLLRWGRGLVRAERRLSDWIPITPLGVSIALFGATVLKLFAYPEMDLVLLVIGYGCLGLTGIAALLVVGGAIRLKLAARRYRGPDERTLETGRSLPTGLSLPSLALVPFVLVWWEWELPSGAAVALRSRGLSLEEDVHLEDRGMVRGIARRIVVQDVFGLARIAIRHADPARLTVLPHCGALKEMPVLVTLAGGDEMPHPMGIDDGDRVELRRYAPGDPARFIHWKVYARARKLVVRVPERALTRARRTIAYLVAGPGDEPVAGAARVAVESGTLGVEWVFGADGTAGDTDEPGPAVDRIVRSVEARAEGALGLRAFVDRAEKTGPASLVLFVPPVPGPWLDRVLALVRHRAHRTRVIVATDGVDVAVPRARWWDLLSRGVERSGTRAEDLDAVVRALAGTRVLVLVLDRTTGRRLGDAHRAAMRALATRAA